MADAVTDPPSVSVIIPARNEAKVLGGSVRSVMKQEYAGPVECIVVDNGSTDGTGGVAREFAQARRTPVRVVREPSAGVAAAKNAGAEAAGGEVLIFLDADSRMAGDLVRAVVASYVSGHRVGSIRVVADGGGRLDRAFFDLMEFGKRHFSIRAQMLYCGRSLFVELGGFDSRLRLGEDVDFLQRAGRLSRSSGWPSVTHVSGSEIRTSPRRLAAHHHLGMLQMFARWALAYMGIGRRRPY